MGNISGDLSLPAGLVSQILRKEISVLGSWNSTFFGRQPSDWTAALDYMSRGLAPSSFTTLKVGLNDLPAALARLHEQKARRSDDCLVKVMVTPQQTVGA
jgi:threonine dehydrogenase-like Zn-dependent dehydrogenase